MRLTVPVSAKKTMWRLKNKAQSVVNNRHLIVYDRHQTEIVK